MFPPLVTTPLVHSTGFSLLLFLQRTEAGSCVRTEHTAHEAVKRHFLVQGGVVWGLQGFRQMGAAQYAALPGPAKAMRASAATRPFRGPARMTGRRCCGAQTPGAPHGPPPTWTTGSGAEPPAERTRASPAMASVSQPRMPLVCASLRTTEEQVELSYWHEWHQRARVPQPCRDTGS